jgi:hypothetical protein
VFSCAAAGVADAISATTTNIMNNGRHSLD